MDNNRWSQLSMAEKNQLLGIYASKGYTDLASIIAHYNSFADGGNLDEPDEPIYVSSQASNTGWMPEAQISADRPQWQQGLTDYDFARAKQYYSNPDGTFTNRGVEFLKNVASKRTTGKSNYMRDVDRLAAIPNAAMLGAGALSGAAFNPYLWYALGLASGVQNIEDKNYGSAAFDIGLTLFPAGKAVVESTKLGKTLKLASEINKAVRSAKLQTKPIKTSYNKYISFKTTNTTAYRKAKDLYLEDFVNEEFFKDLAKQVDDNEEFIKKANKYFYNYPPIKYDSELLRDTDKVNQLVKDRIEEHNTFLRGIRDPMSSPHKYDQINAQKLNKKLEELGISPTRENRLKYMATHYAGNTGSGRAGINNDLFQGALYTSNSLNTAAGYAMSHDLKPVGEIAIVRRPYSLGSDRNQWFKEGDFNLYSNDYGRPQDFHDIIDRSSINKLREQGILSGNLSKKEIGEIYDKVYKGLYEIYDSHVDDINTILKDAGINFLVDKKLKPTEKDLLFAQNLNNKLIGRIPNPIQLNAKQLLFTGSLASPEDKALQIVHNPSLRFGIKDETKKQGYRLVRKKEMEKYLPQLNDFVKDRVDDPFSTRKDEFFSKETIEFLQHIEPVPLIKSLNRKVYLSKNDFISSMPSSHDVSTLKKRIGFRLHQEINRKIPEEAYNNLYENFKNLAPTEQISDKPYVFTTEKTRISPIGENYQHYIFRGPVGQKALDFIDFVPKDKYVGLDYISRQHTGESFPGISRKTFAQGGHLHLDGGIEDKPYIPGQEQNYGYLKPVNIVADHPYRSPLYGNNKDVPEELRTYEGWQRYKNAVNNVRERPYYEGIKKFEMAAALGAGLGPFANVLSSGFNSVVNTALQGSKTALGAAGKMMLPSTWSTAAGLSSGFGAGLDAAMFSGMAANAGKELTTGSNWQPGGRYNNDNWGGFQGGSNFLLDATMLAPVFNVAKGGVKLVGNAANFARNWRLTVPEDASRYYRIVDNRAIDDAIQSGVIRGPGATEDLANAFRQSVKSETHFPLLIKAHEYPMFAKGKPWQGSTARIDKGKPSIIRSKKDTGSIIWQESNKDFRHKGHSGIFRPSFYGDLNASPTQYFEYWEPKKFGYLRHDFPTLDQAMQEAKNARIEVPEVLSAREPFEMQDIPNWREIFSNYNPNTTRTVRTTVPTTEFKSDMFDYQPDVDKRLQFFEPGKFLNYDLSKMSVDEVVKTFGPDAKHLKNLYDLAAAHNFEGKYADLAKDVESKISKMFAINPEDIDIAAGIAKARSIYDIPEYIERFKKYGDLGETFIQDAKSRLDNIQLQGLSRDSKITGQHGTEGGASTTPHPTHPTIRILNYDKSSIIREFMTHEANHAAHGTHYQPKWMEIHNEKIRPVPKKDRKDFNNYDKYLDEMDELVERSKTAVEYANETRLEGETLDQALDRVFEAADKDVYNSEIPSDIRQMVKNYTKDSVLKFWKEFLGGLSVPIGVGIGASQSQSN